VAGGRHTQPGIAHGPQAVAHPDLSARVRRRLARLNTSARLADHQPWNNPISVRHATRAVGAWLVLLAVNVMLMMMIAVSGRDHEWKHDRISDVVWFLAGQTAVLLLGAAGCWLVGVWRTVRRRAPVLRRRHTGRVDRPARQRPHGGQPGDPSRGSA
jgi:hypothetical protein